MEKKEYYKYLFLLAAIWNWIVTVSFLILSFVAPDILSLFGVEIPPSLVFLQMLFVLIGIFGFGFFLVYLDSENNHGIVQMAILEKISFFVVFLIYFIFGDVGILVLMLVIVDLIFGLLFIEFLLNFKKL
jgi:hypothetical protein